MHPQKAARPVSRQQRAGLFRPVDLRTSSLPSECSHDGTGLVSTRLGGLPNPSQSGTHRTRGGPGLVGILAAEGSELPTIVSPLPRPRRQSGSSRGPERAAPRSAGGLSNPWLDTAESGSPVPAKPAGRFAATEESALPANA